MYVVMMYVEVVFQLMAILLIRSKLFYFTIHKDTVYSIHNRQELSHGIGNKFLKYFQIVLRLFRRLQLTRYEQNRMER